MVRARLRLERSRNRWEVAGLVALALLVAAVVPTGGAVAGGPAGFWTLDRWLHAAGYGLLQGVVLRATAADPEPPLPALATPPSVLAYGTALEGVQAFLPYRSMSSGDVLADAVGIAAAVAGWVVVSRLR